MNVSAPAPEEHTTRREIDEIGDRLRLLVNWLNQRAAFEGALRAQTALVAVHDICGIDDADLEESYP